MSHRELVNEILFLFQGYKNGKELMCIINSSRFVGDGEVKIELEKYRWNKCR